MISERLANYLEGHGVGYRRIPHMEAFTAQEIAAALHVPGKDLAKVVVLTLDGQFAMAVIPAPHRINFDRLRAATGARHIGLASEDEMRRLFPDCEPGAMPPYGNLYGLPVYVAQPLARDKEIVFEGGSHREALRVTYADYARLVNPTVLDFTSGPL